MRESGTQLAANVFLSALLAGCAARVDPDVERRRAEEARQWEQSRAAALAAGVRMPPDIPGQSVIRNIFLWDDDVAVVTEDWAATGLAHLSGQEGGLYRLAEGRAPEAIAFIAGHDPGDSPTVTQQQGVPLPRFSTITGLTLGSKRQLLIVLPDFGVYELVDGRLARIYAGPLRFSHLDVFEGLEGVISSSPVGIVVTPDGDVYLGHRSLAVMRLPREGARLTQYLFRR